MADPISLLAIGGGLLLLAKARRGQAETTAIEKPSTGHELGSTGQDTQKQVSDLVKGAIGVGTAVAGAIKGGAISATTLTSAMTVAAPIISIGVAVAAGWGLGYWLDRIFGGKGDGATGLTLSAGLATTLGVTVAVLLFSGAAAAGATFPALLLVAGLAYAVAWIFTDYDALRYGKLRQTDEAFRLWYETHEKLLPMFEAAADPKGSTMPKEMAARAAQHATDGYVAQWNRLNWLAWMRRGSLSASHAQAGWDRGAFLGWFDRTGALVEPRFVNKNTYRPAREYSRANWIGLAIDNQTKTYETPLEEQLPETTDLSFENFEAKKGRKPGTYPNMSPYAGRDGFGPAIDATGDVLTSQGIDKARAPLYWAGRTLCNVTGFVKQCKAWHLMNGSRFQHALNGLRDGFYEGTVVSGNGKPASDPNATAVLFWMGKYWDENGKVTSEPQGQTLLSAPTSAQAVRV